MFEAWTWRDGGDASAAKKALVGVCIGALKGGLVSGPPKEVYTRCPNLKPFSGTENGPSISHIPKTTFFTLVLNSWFRFECSRLLGFLWVRKWALEAGAQDACKTIPKQQLSKQWGP